jgi:hypothetical protein
MRFRDFRFTRKQKRWRTLPLGSGALRRDAHAGARRLAAPTHAAGIGEGIRGYELSPVVAYQEGGSAVSIITILIIIILALIAIYLVRRVV